RLPGTGPPASVCRAISYTVTRQPAPSPAGLAPKVCEPGCYSPSLLPGCACRRGLQRRRHGGADAHCSSRLVARKWDADLLQVPPRLLRKRLLCAVAEEVCAGLSVPGPAVRSTERGHCAASARSVSMALVPGPQL